MIIAPKANGIAAGFREGIERVLFASPTLHEVRCGVAMQFESAVGLNDVHWDGGRGVNSDRGMEE
jgi:hypothetical protein